MKKNILLSVLACGLLLSTSSLQAKTGKQTLIQTAAQKHNKDLQVTPKIVMEGLQATFKAVNAIRANKIDEAKRYLALATEDFNKALKANPKLDLLPVDEKIAAYIYDAPAKVIKDALDLSVQLIKDHDTQVVRETLEPMRDELDINIVSIPMKLYPASTKKALEALNKNDKKAALDALAEGFGMLVSTKIVIPLPLLAAHDLVIEASKLDKKKKDEAMKLLDAAKEELKRAELLGYTKKHEPAYKLLNEDIEKVEKEIKGENKVEKFYETLKKDFEDFIGKIHVEKVKAKNPAEAKVNAYEQKEEKQAKKEANVFEQEAKSDEKKEIK